MAKRKRSKKQQAIYAVWDGYEARFFLGEPPKETKTRSQSSNDGGVTWNTDSEDSEGFDRSSDYDICKAFMDATQVKLEKDKIYKLKMLEFEEV